MTRRLTLSDLALLAKWAPTLTGKGMDPDRPSLTPPAVPGRPEHVDTHHESLHRAILAARR